MIEKKIEVYAESFAQHNLSNVELIVEVNNDYLVLALSKIDDKKIIAYEYFEFNAEGENWNTIFSEAKAQSKIFLSDYATCRLFYNVPEMLVVPALYDDEENAKTYLNTFYGNLKTNAVEINKLQAFNNVSIVYSVDEQLKQIIDDSFKPASVQHTCSKLLQKIYRTEQNENRKNLHLFFYNKMFVVVLVKNTQLQFIKPVNYTLPNDMLYFILNVIKQYGVNIDDVQLKVAGFINIDSAELAALQNYFAHVIIQKPTEANSAEHFFNNFPEHYFTPFFYLQA